ncbi:WecB/TagA/CpsF family glycosyltransferase, partial [Akkermansiaceae bacterium]|nr:WecB/TagA/CpsF family glycosyltransferase [Akkermansiaceae bacterium]
PDGIGVVWALKRRGHRGVIKIAGCEIWLQIIKKYYTDKSFYLIGGSQKVIEQTVSKLRTDFPCIRILNYRNGFFDNENEEKALIQDVKNFGPDFVFVGCGSPRQEILMQSMQQEHDCIYQGLGGSFDVYTGKKKRAPDFWIKANLEWAYRLVSQPSRIKRQVVYIKFFIKLIFNKL